MTIGIDLRCVPKDGSAGAGIAHAARELTRVLVAHSNVTWKTYQRGFSLRRALKESPCDVLLVPSGAVSVGLSVPAIPWVHDLAIYGHSEWFPQNVIQRAFTTFAFRHGVQRAPRVLAVSEYTKNEIIRLFHVDPNLIDVTLEGGDPILASLHAEQIVEAKKLAKKKLVACGITKSFVLALGTVEPRKNIAMLIRAWKQVVIKYGCSIDLVIAGQDGWKYEDVARAIQRLKNKDLNGSRLHRITSLSDEDRRELLLAAEIVAVPSLSEGFGLVALEAMQANTAVVVSDEGALPEVVQEGGVQLSPKDMDAWSTTFRDLMLNEKIRNEQAQKGKKRSEEFSWEKVAKIAIEGLTKSNL